MKTATKTKTLIDNNVSTKNILQLTDGVSTFCGVMSRDNETFFPFYCVDSEDIVTFEHDARIPHDEEDDVVWLDKRPVSEIRAAYAAQLASGANKIANLSIFEAVMADIKEKAGVPA